MSVECDQLRERVARLEVLVKERDRQIHSELLARDQALVTQAKEYERRLEILNHESTRVNKIVTERVSGDVFLAERDRVEQSMKTMHDTIEQQARTDKAELGRVLENHGADIGTLQVQIAGGTGQLQVADKAWDRATRVRAIWVSAAIGVLVLVVSVALTLATAR